MIELLVKPTSNKETETKKPQVYLHVASLAPWCTLVGNKTLVRWTEATGADKMEWIAAGPIISQIPIGPTYEVLTKKVSELRKIFKGKLGAGHAALTPFSSPWTIGRKVDPTNPNYRMALFHTMFATEKVSAQALKKLEQVQDHFPVNVYPPFQGRNLQQHYRYSRLQTHPKNLDDCRTAKELIEAVKSAEYPNTHIKQITADLYHMREATSQGLRPLGNTEAEIFITLEKFVKAGVLGEVHVQPDRLIYADDSLAPPSEELKDILSYNPHYNTFTGRSLKFLIGTLGFMGPFTIEVDPRALVKVVGKRVFLPPNISPILPAYASIVEYIRQASNQN